MKGKDETVEMLLEQEEADINHTDTHTIELYVAAYKGHKKKVKMLIEKHIFVDNHASINGSMALYAAAYNGHVKIVKMLLKKEGIDVNHAGILGRTALHAAANR